MPPRQSSNREMYKCPRMIVAVLVTVAGLGLWSVAERLKLLPRSGCPILARMMPINRSEIQASDYIEFDAMAIGPHIYEPVHVRIYGNGLVERDTVMKIGSRIFGCPLHDADKTLRIPVATARTLLERARDNGFCGLCSSYQHDVFDGGLNVETLSLHRNRKSVWNHNGEPPPLFDDLAGRILALSGVHALADTSNFSSERKAECESIEAARFHR
jgi:hypothetical protein